MRLLGDSIKAKVVVGFGLALGVVVFAIYLTYASFTKLLNSVDVLSEPNRKLISLQHTLATISAAESSIRAYTLTTKEDHFKDYLNHLDSIDDQLDTLHALMLGNPEQVAQVDSISALLTAKQESLQRFIALKKEQQNLDLHGKAMRQIASSAEEKPLSTIIKQHTTTTISDRLSLKDKSDSVKDNEEAKAKKGFLSKLFSKKTTSPEQPKPLPEVIKPEINVTQEIKVDTNTAATKVAPLSKVRRILFDVQREAEEQAEQLEAKELALLQQDKHIMDQIRGMMYELEYQEMERSIDNSARARVVAQDTSIVLLLVGIAGLGGGIAFILLIFRDITRSNNYRSQLIKAQKEAVSLARAKEAFVANMSHEMRTPLNVILGFANQLQHTSLQNKQQEFTQAINGAGQHLLNIVNDVLDLSKIEAGKLNISSTPFNISQLLTEVEQAFALKASSKDIEFKCHLDDKLPFNLQGDVLRIKQILFNLLDNAIKFTHMGQVKLEISCVSLRRNKVVVNISVSDTGIGIPTNRIQHIFGEFNQADDSILRRYGGTGLGLSISKKLTEMLGGTLTVQSEPGKGTNFDLVLPLQKATQSIETKTGTSPVVANFKGLKALVIDDDAYSRTLAELILKRWGMEISLANDGQEALDLAKEQRFDIVLTDLQLPGVSGKTVSRAIRKHQKGVPILAVTANILSNDKDFFKGSAISDYILKPYTESELHLKLAKSLNVTSTDEIQESEEKYVEIKPVNKPYSLHELRQFTGEDANTLVAVLEVMLDDQRNNLQQLRAFSEDKKWEEVANVAHKMLTGFKHLHAQSVTPGLEKLEQVLHSNSSPLDELSIIAQQTILNTENILEALQEELEEIKETAGQTTT
jgi:signal transduction histidine kinase/DNA-binding response OmpR family regulator